MADAIGIVPNVDWGSVGQGVATFLMWFLVALLGLILIWFVWYWFSFKNTYELRDVTNNRKILRSGRWKVIKDKKGNRWFVSPFYNQMFGRAGLKKSLPPEESIELRSNGRKHVQGWRIADQETILWAKDNFSADKYKTSKGDEFQPLDTAEREMLTNEITKAREYEGKSGWQVLMQIAMVLIPVIMVIVIAMSLGEITGALGDMMAQVTEPLSKLVNQLGAYTDTLSGIQTISDAPAAPLPPG